MPDVSADTFDILFSIAIRFKQAAESLLKRQEDLLAQRTQKKENSRALIPQISFQETLRRRDERRAERAEKREIMREELLR